MDETVEIITTTPRSLAVVCFRCGADAIPNRIGDAFARVGAYLGESGQRVTGPAVGYFRMRDGAFDVRAGFPGHAPVTGDATVMSFELPAMEVATTEHIGAYDTLPACYERMRAAMAARGRQLDESAGEWEEYWSPPGTPPEAVRTVIYWPLVAA